MGDFPEPKFQSAMAEYDLSPSTDIANYYIFGGFNDNSPSLNILENIDVKPDGFEYNSSYINTDPSLDLTALPTGKHGASAELSLRAGLSLLYTLSHLRSGQCPARQSGLHSSTANPQRPASRRFSLLTGGGRGTAASGFLGGGRWPRDGRDRSRGTARGGLRPGDQAQRPGGGGLEKGLSDGHVGGYCLGQPSTGIFHLLRREGRRTHRPSAERRSGCRL